MRVVLRILGFVLGFGAVHALAQIGGDGRDGVFRPLSNVTIGVDSRQGVFQYESITIPSRVTVRLTGHYPVFWLVRGDVLIEGTVDLRGEDAQGEQAGRGGPGGWDGSDGTSVFGWAQPGEGPGGGGVPQAGWYGGPAGHEREGRSPSHPSIGGAAYGSVLPFDLSGGSGGSGEHASWGSQGDGGGGGGGTLVILCDGSITLRGTIDASGGGFQPTSGWSSGYGGGGSGGSVLLRALGEVTIPLGARIHARGYDNQAGTSSPGFVRIDAYAALPSIQGQIDPLPEVLTLPHLFDDEPPRIGTPYVLRVAACPTDWVSLFFSAGGASIPLPPFGIGLLDPVLGIAMLGSRQVPPTGHDPLAAFGLPVPQDPLLIGFPLHFQVLSFPTPTNQPFLSNDVVRWIGS